MNFLFAWLLYVVVFASGVTASPVGFERYAAYATDPRIMITSVLPGSPAEQAGLKEGDVIKGIFKNGTDVTKVSAPITYSSADVQTDVNSCKGDLLELEYVRDGATKTAVMAPVPGLVADKYAIGIGVDDVVDLKLPLLSAISEGTSYTLELIKETVIGLYGFVADIFRGAPDFSGVAGPIGIAGIVGNAAGLGLAYLLMVTAIISINLGVVNLIPFPALDGGRILFVGLEALFRRRIPAAVANTMNAIGFGLLMILMVAVTWKDVAKLFK